jgi:hypothetical protein
MKPLCAVALRVKRFSRARVPRELASVVGIRLTSTESVGRAGRASRVAWVQTTFLGRVLFLRVSICHEVELIAGSFGSVGAFIFRTAAGSRRARGSRDPSTR